MPEQAFRVPDHVVLNDRVRIHADHEVIVFQIRQDDRRAWFIAPALRPWFFTELRTRTPCRGNLGRIVSAVVAHNDNLIRRA